MSPKTGGLVAQAVGVAALGAVVYFAFLNPGDPGTLSEIAVSDGVTVTAPQPSAHHPRRQLPAPKPRRARKRGAPTPAITPSTTPNPETTPPSADTPVGSQYADAVARILDSVARGSP
jgi:hypothetical protein